MADKKLAAVSRQNDESQESKERATSIAGGFLGDQPLTIDLLQNQTFLAGHRQGIGAVELTKFGRCRVGLDFDVQAADFDANAGLANDACPAVLRPGTVAVMPP